MKPQFKYTWDKVTERDLEVRAQISHMLKNGFRMDEMKSKLRQLG